MSPTLAKLSRLQSAFTCALGRTKGRINGSGLITKELKASRQEGALAEVTELVKGGAGKEPHLLIPSSQSFPLYQAAYLEHKVAVTLNSLNQWLRATQSQKEKFPGSFIPGHQKALRITSMYF